VTRYVVDAGAVLRIVAEDLPIAPVHVLLAPTLLRSQTLSLLHEAVARGDLPDEVARDRHTKIRSLPIRLLGDAVLQRRAWAIADGLGWPETYAAEYLALTLLQADAFVTTDELMARRLEGIVEIATVEDLGRP
jgi:hypothetical protein